MGLYNVVAAGVVDGKHYTRPAKARDIDDAVAAPLVEAGTLEAYEPPVVADTALTAVIKGNVATAPVEPAEVEPATTPQPRPRARRTEG